MRKVFLRTLLYTFLLLSAIMGGGVFALKTEMIKEFIVQKALKKLEEEKQIKVTYTSLEGLLPFYITAKEVTLFDQGQKWIRVEKVKASLLPWHLFHFQVTLPEVEVTDITFFEKKITPQESVAKPNPWNLEISQLSFKRLNLGLQPLYGFCHFVLDGHSGTSHLEAYLFPEGAPERLSTLSLTSQRVGTDLTLQGHFKEDADGILKEKAGLKQPFGIEGSVALLGPQISFKRLLSNLPEPADKALQGAFEITLLTPQRIATSSEVTLQTDRAVQFNGLKVVTSGIQITGQAALDASQNFHDTQVKVALDLLKLTPLEGTLIAHLDLKGSLQELEATVQADGVVDKIPLQASGELHLKDKLLEISDTTVSLPYTTSNFTGSLDIPTKKMTGEGNLSSKDISFLSGLVGHKLAGRGSANFHLLDEEDTLQVELELKEGRFDEFWIQNLSGLAQLQDLLGTPEGYFKLQGKRFSYQDWQLSEIELFSAFDTEEKLWTWELETHTNDAAALDLLCKGSWQPKPHWLAINIDTLAARLGDYEHVLTKPVDLKVSPKSFTLSDLALGVRGSEGEGYILADIILEEDLSDVRIKVGTLPLEGLSKLFPAVPIWGTLSGEARLMNESGQLALTWQKPIANSNLEGKLTAHLRGDDVQATCNIEGVGSEPWIAATRFKVKRGKSPLEWSVDPKSPLSGTLAFHGDIGPILHLFATDFTRLKGDTAISLALSGTLDHPSFSGYVKLRNGTYESLYNGVTFHNVSADIEASGERLQLSDFSANDDNKGSISGAGVILLSPKKGFPYDISLITEEVLLARFDFGRIASNGHLRLSGNENVGTLSGNLDITAADFTIPKKLPQSIPQLEVTYVNGAPQSAGRVVGPKERMQILLDLEVDVPGNVHVEGRGLKSEWKGSFKLSGDMAEPEIFGNLKVDQGEFLFSGRPFILTQGTLSFDGPKDKTELQVHGELQLPDVKVIVVLKGPLQNPKLFFYSNPTLPEKEILSLILFNKHTAEISAFQAVQLTQTISDISGNRIAPDVLGNIRRSIGLDRLDLDTACDSNELSIQAGKYLSRGVYVMVSKSINSESNAVGIEAQLTPSVKVQGQASAERGSQLSLKWSKDY